MYIMIYDVDVLVKMVEGYTRLIAQAGNCEDKFIELVTERRIAAAMVDNDGVEFRNVPFNIGYYTELC